MTPKLYHGPAARDIAVAAGVSAGRPLRDPMGDAGLKVDDSRIIVEMAQNPGVGAKPPTLVVGPLDIASPEALDALLKTLEDLSESPLRLLLWADHLSGVTPTILSRTHETWCPASSNHLDNLHHLKGDALRLCGAALEQDRVRICSILHEAGKEWPDLLRALCAPLAQKMCDISSPAPTAALLWRRVRRVLDGKGSHLVAVDALLLDL